MDEEKITTIMTDTTDRISHLPEFILHNILSYLDSPKQLVRMSVLSKNWFALTASFPHLNFNLREFLNIKRPYWIPLDPDTFRHERDNFLKYVDYTTSRFCQQKEVISVHTLNLSIELNDHTQVDIIDKCIRQVIKRGIQELVIHIVNTPMYRVPNIFLSASRLTSLKIRECELPLSLMVDVVKFESLKLLFLYTVPLNDEVIKGLTTSFPLLETLVVEFCYGFKRFCVFGHQSLQQVKIRFRCELERIDIEAPNLDYLYIEDLFEIGAPSMNLTSCKKLTTLSYNGYPSPTSDGGLADLSSSFPFLEELFLRPSYDCKKLKLSSHSVKRFVLYSDCDLEEIDMNTPNLLLFECKSHLSSYFFPAQNRSLPSKARMECHRNKAGNTRFQNLRRFLDKNMRFQELKLFNTPDCLDFEELKLIQLAPYELDHFELEVDAKLELSEYVAAMDAILWCFRPRTLTLESNLSLLHIYEQRHLFKLIYEKLLHQEDEGQTSIQIVMSSNASHGKEHFSDLNSLLENVSSSLSDQPRKTITFIKEVVQEKAG